ncbi:MAG: hypothetical protein JSU63_13485 [Phycisphaerales bacterium]|nr:MAG: hypothetical protein JSU63_13485 [Phycisphaerales bacterium]
MRTTRYRLGFTIVVGSVVCVLVGCQDKLTHARFSRIQVGYTTPPEVVALIGDPNDKLDNKWIYERPQKSLTVLVDFDDAKHVSRTQWIDAEVAIWEDSSESPADENSHETIRIEKRRD